MKSIFKIGDSISLNFDVTQKDLATFEGNNIHNVYSTFALGRDIEWTCRQFVIQMKEEFEEGIGTFLLIKHLSPALLGSKVVIEAFVKSLERNEIICSYLAKVDNRVIAEGEQGQKIIKKEKLESIFFSLQEKD